MLPHDVKVGFNTISSSAQFSKRVKGKSGVRLRPKIRVIKLGHHLGIRKGTLYTPFPLGHKERPLGLEQPSY